MIISSTMSLEAVIAIPSSYTQADVETIVKMVNVAYDYGEKGMWNDGFTRTTSQGVSDLLDAHKLLVAKLEGAIVGCIKLDTTFKTQRHDGTPACMAEIGMLAVQQSNRRQGLGKRLMNAAIMAAQAANCQGIELQLVKPKTWPHRVKTFLAHWYTTLGFTLVGRQDDVAEFARIAQFLAVEVVVELYEMAL